ncbi:MAG: HU family DNA-binding protein [Acidimicrobiales bacterium]
MNKAELIGAIASRTGQSAAAVGEALASLETVVTEEVAGGGKVTIPGFLTFDRTERAARTGRNPATGAELHIPAATVPRVKVGKGFKDAVGKK